MPIDVAADAGATDILVSHLALSAVGAAGTFKTYVGGATLACPHWRNELIVGSALGAGEASEALSATHRAGHAAAAIWCLRQVITHFAAGAVTKGSAGQTVVFTRETSYLVSED